MGGGCGQSQNEALMWRLTTEERELGEHMVKGPARQAAGGGDHWGESALVFKHVECGLAARCHLEAAVLT